LSHWLKTCFLFAKFLGLGVCLGVVLRLKDGSRLERIVFEMIGFPRSPKILVDLRRYVRCADDLRTVEPLDFSLERFFLGVLNNQP
jgi:hypothetical protein